MTYLIIKGAPQGQDSNAWTNWECQQRDGKYIKNTNRSYGAKKYKNWTKKSIE